MNLQELILGKNIPGTASDRRKVVLGAYLICIYIGIGLFFAVVNLFNEEGDPTSLFIGFIISIACLFLLRKGFINTALVIHLLRTNFMAYYFCLVDTDPLQTGSYLYFVPSSLGALAVFGYRERWKGIGFTILSFVLFSIAIYNPSHFHPNNPHFFFIVTFLILLIIGILIIIFFDQMVMDSEKSILAKNEELSKTNQELDRFVYSASHDLRAPLTSMAGLIQLAQHDSTRATEYLGLMKDRVKVMDNYIKDIVEYSRNTRVELRIEKFGLRDLLEDIIASLQYASSNKVEVEIQIEPGLKVNTDMARLRVVLNNLISNAFKYQDTTKANPYLRVSGLIDSDICSIHIEDNGIGIREEHHKNLFNMFYRANDVTEGSGLGLYIARENVSKLKGTISFTSTYGLGSRFTVHIPA
ncbi:MAG TPA: HAMP domain-containing sensor histidine kinase [Cyclobacteriaceae bacterium]|nr:HAMP domain-containing histidine kinase [Cytophagales bacterium]HMR55933.1 HAMP domain-containing sensor histidine kinase [Cyclobacteriaceae bacterium]HRE67507.1 HAMP domain-containing sensor histidine kinase [Cyclobacteriaceae bacterium]HRF33386.1 HAMP domain-containing sensor histidine kinase [Cyclobacteriaceae bacterium]